MSYLGRLARLSLGRALASRHVGQENFDAFGELGVLTAYGPCRRVRARTTKSGDSRRSRPPCLRLSLRQEPAPEWQPQ